MCANEFAHALQSAHLSDAQFWAEWLFAWQRRCSKQKTSCDCATRATVGITEKDRTTPALLLWQVLRGVAQGSPILDTTVRAWEELFIVRYSGKVNSCRASLLLAAVYAVCNRSMLIPTLPVSNANLIPSVNRGLPQIYQRLAAQAGLEYYDGGRVKQEGSGGLVVRGRDKPDLTNGLFDFFTPNRHRPI